MTDGNQNVLRHARDTAVAAAGSAGILPARSALADKDNLARSKKPITRCIANPITAVALLSLRAQSEPRP